MKKVRETMAMKAIYRLINLTTGKSYVGQSVNVIKRRLQHFSNLKCGRHENDYLQKSYNKYGQSSFIFEILEEIDGLTQEEVNNREKLWIEHFNSYDEGYNLTQGGDGTQGRSFSIEERKKRSIKMAGSGNHFFGKKHSIETRKRLSAIGSLRTGSKNHFYGKTHSEDWKEQRQLLYKRKKEAGWVSPNKGMAKPKEAVRAMKQNMPQRKEIVVDGIEYASISECSRKLGLHRATIRLRLGRQDFPNYQYKQERK